MTSSDNFLDTLNSAIIPASIREVSSINKKKKNPIVRKTYLTNRKSTQQSININIEKKLESILNDLAMLLNQLPNRKYRKRFKPSFDFKKYTIEITLKK